MERKSALVATLGTEPQVLTLCLQELIARGEKIVKAIGLHSRSKDPAIAEGIARLKEEWSLLPFGREVQLELEEVPVTDLQKPNWNPERD